MPNPTYIAVAAVSIDGYITPIGKPGSSWTSPEDKQFLHDILNTADVIIVGHATYTIARKPLAKRNCIVLTRKIPATKKTGKLSLYLNPANVDLGDTIQQLGYKRVIILGGSQTYTYCLEKGLLDEIYLTIEPVIFGAGLPMFGSSKLPNLGFKLVENRNLNAATMLLHYKN
jgi:dihydrofolate reductase